MVRVCRPDVSCPDGLSLKCLKTVDKGHFRKYIQSQEQRRTHGDRDLYPNFQNWTYQLMQNMLLI